MDWNWVRYMKTLDHPSFWIWLLIFKEVFFVLLIFKVWSGNWGGFKKKKTNRLLRKNTKKSEVRNENI